MIYSPEITSFLLNFQVGEEGERGIGGGKERERKGENKGEGGRECEGDDDFLFLLPVLFMFF